LHHAPEFPHLAVQMIFLVEGVVDVLAVAVYVKLALSVKVMEKPMVIVEIDRVNQVR